MGKKNLLNIDEQGIIPLNDTIPNIKFPILERKPYPEANPKEPLKDKIYYLYSETYVIDSHNNVGYRDSLSGDTIYLNRLNTIFDRQRIVKVVESVGKPLIPSTRGSEAINFNNLQWGVINSPKTNYAAYISARQGIFLNLDKEGGICINIYELQSIFRHELLHFVDAEKWDNYSGKRRFSFGDHADIYLEQMQYPEFLKTSADFQLDIVENFYVRLWNHFDKNGYNLDRFKDTLKAFNDGIGKKINIRIEAGENTTPGMKRGEPTKNFKIIQGKNELPEYKVRSLENPFE